MLSRPRHDPTGVDPAQRVRELLALPGKGWVPPPELPGAAEGPELDAAPLVQASWQPAWSETGSPPAAGLAALLPVSLVTGRFDPGRRGAIALVIVALRAATIAALVVLRGRPQEVLVAEVLASGRPLPGVSAPALVPSAPPAGEVVVAVAGDVQAPGLVRLPAGSRVDDAVRAAGGALTPDALGLLNLARVLVDGEQVLVGVEPPPGAPAAGGAGSAGGAGAPALVDLNAATVSDLDALPGIGPVLAQRIVDWRSDNGSFASVDQLREVTGIGEATFDELRDQVTV